MKVRYVDTVDIEDVVETLKAAHRAEKLESLSRATGNRKHLFEGRSIHKKELLTWKKKLEEFQGPTE